MRGNNRTARPSGDATHRERSAPRNHCQWMAGACLLASLALTAQAAAPVRDRTAVAAPAYIAEARTCSPCHAALVNNFAGNPHGRPVSTRDRNRVTCASCHGSQKAHLETGGGNTPDPALGTDGQADQMCLKCHQGSHPASEPSSHATKQVSCTACHGIHSQAGTKHLLKADQPALCYQCHAEVKTAFSMPSRHNVESGLVQCTDCHDPHAPPQQGPHSSPRLEDSFCTNCHTRVAGPFAFEHAVTKTEGCAACHFPHGGPNTNLLRRADIDAICQTCHFPPPDPATGAHLAPAMGQAGPSKPCTDCHADVHGSSRSAFFLRPN